MRSATSPRRSREAPSDPTNALQVRGPSTSSLAAASPVGVREALPAKLVRPGPRVRPGAQATQDSRRRPDAATRRFAELVPRQRRRDRRPVPGAQGIRRDGRGAAPVTEVVDEDLAGALGLRHARDVLLRISPHQVLHNVPGETLDGAPVGLWPCLLYTSP